MQVFVAQNDPKILLELKYVLQAMGYTVEATKDADLIKDFLKAGSFDLIVLDEALNGLSVIIDYRNNGGYIPILFTAPSGHLGKALQALEKGADDYLLKPFVINIFQAKIRALMRRQSVQKSPVLTYGPLKIDTQSRMIWLENSALKLTPRERRVLEILLKNTGRIIHKDHIASQLFSFDEDVNPTAIETYIYRLRRKAKHPLIDIKTVYGTGYILELKVEDDILKASAG